MKSKIIAVLSVLLLTAAAQNTLAGGRQEAEETGAQKEVTIEFFQGKPEAVDTFNVLIDKFEQEYPGIHVTQVHVPDAAKVLTTRISINDIPDIFNCYVTQPSFKLLTEEGYVLDITEEGFLSRVNSGILETAKYSGRAFAFPLALNTFGIYYNVDIFNEYGLTVPESWNELIALCEELKNSGMTPIVFTDKDSWTLGHQGRVLEGMLVDDFDAYYGSLASGAVKPSEALYPIVADKMLKMREYSQKQTLATDYGQGIAAFAQGEAAMFVNGIWSIPSIKKANPDLNFEVFPIPADDPAKQRVLTGIDVALAVSASSEHQDAALKFLDFLSRKENAQIYADLDGSPSAINGIAIDAENYSQLMELIDTGAVYGWTSIYYPLSVYNEYGSLYQNLIARDKESFLDEIDMLYKQTLE